ncbi:helix-turn-helix domain-containing protein [Paenibacillus protaetiae]|uniref:Cytoskeleton protein RodZ-like C-terminal domain-containing protein n=1 Tax=Paenibacillus protaetiae TaxID=2509456 RepID=A0A4P6F5I0_9BACL|nr:RodZ domain-containing protein [Paenibacillus protaetiae]QAY65658.1 hypothetical protein ET464_03925 [Paenibacillus protaetiae]
MSDLGALLRKAREESGLTLDDIQEITKIRKRYLEALESGDHSVLPGSFYVRAFVKNYSEAVGLDPDEVLRLYQHEIPAGVPEQSVEPIVSRASRRVRTRSSDRGVGKIGFNIVMWCFLILIVAVVWIFIINQKDDPTKVADNTNITDKASPPAETASADPVASSTPTPTPTPTPPQTTVTFTGKVGKIDHYDVAGTNVKVELKVSGGVNWTEVDSGGPKGKRLTYKNLEDGTVLDYDLTEPLYINIGRADFVQITVDGVLIDDGDQSTTKRIQLDPVTATDTGTPSDNNTASSPPAESAAAGQ